MSASGKSSNILSEKSHKKYQHEKCVVLLDDCFCNGDVAGALSAGGFVLELFTKYFPRDGAAPDGKREQGVKDSRVIALSHKHKMVILTTDHRMRDDHEEQFAKYPQAMVVATAHKTGSDELWVKAFIKARPEIERKHKKQLRPWFGKISQEGNFTCCQSLRSDGHWEVGTDAKANRKGRERIAVG